ncbi:MAG: radical SAM protein [Candidatus Omnitrophica bacterium]|nr:radical SAM protein [Candidatus Omnitrophota bacterium]
MKVVLINLPWHFGLGSYKLLARRFISQIPLALCYLAAVLRRDGHQVCIIDGATGGRSIYDIAREVHEFNPAIVAIGSTTFIHPLAEKLAALIKQKNPSLCLINGGYHISALKEKVLEESRYFDIGIYGEGEITLSEVVRKIEDKESLHTVRGVIFKEGGRIHVNPGRALIPSLDDIPLPARDLLNKAEYYRYKSNKKVMVTGFIASRGCTFGCIFCGCHNVFGKEVRYRSPKLVVDEIEECIEKYGIRGFMSYDDTFTLNRKFIMEMCEEIIKRGIKIDLIAATRVDCVDKEMLLKLKEAGLSEIGFGVESGNQDILDRINKKITLNQIRESLHLAKSLGLVTYTTAMIGNPYETRKTVKDTIDFLSSNRDLDVTMLSIATPLPGTKLYEMSQRGEGGIRVIPGTSLKYNRYGGSIISVNDITHRDLVKCQFFGLIRFYCNPRRAIVQIRLLGLNNFLLTAWSFLRFLFETTTGYIIESGKNGYRKLYAKLSYN